MDSPKARTPGTFSWQATLWHELAHVITLQMSNQRVPRWLTEGVSVYEEGARPVRPGAARWKCRSRSRSSGAEVLKLRDLNSGFTKPRHDRAAVLPGVAARRTHRRHARRGGAPHAGPRYGDGAEGDAAISKGLGISIDELQATFDKMLDARFSAGAARAQREAGDRRAGCRAATSPP